MLNESDAQRLLGRTAYDTDGNKVGKVGQVFLDDTTGRPDFATVNTGLFGTKESFVPLQDARLDGDDLVVAVHKDQVKDAPNVDLDGDHLDPSEEQRLFAHYQMSSSSGPDSSDSSDARTSGTAGAAGTSGTGDTGKRAGADFDRGQDTSGPTTDDAMTRSEEQVRVGTTTEEAGRVRLRKYVTTEMETHTVPVRKEPITDANAGDALDGPAISEEEHEVVLHEERPVVEKTTEPVERVRLGTETETDEQTVSEEVRKEHIEAEGQVDDRR
jgi:stress response protein YsnF